MAYSCLFGFRRFGCFCVSYFAFLFGVGFVSVCLLCVVLWDVVVPASVFFSFFCLFCFFFCFFFFFVRSCFLFCFFFWFFFVFLFFVSLKGLRVR